MNNETFDIGEQIDLRRIEYKLFRNLWDGCDLGSVDISLENWESVKYLNDSASGLHRDINKIPNDTGGLYMFSIHCPIIVGRTEFPVYIGRAQYTRGQNLRKRCREYFNKFALGNERPKIFKMIKYWGDSLYLSFMPLNDNSHVVDLEKKLINSLLLPFNDQIPNVTIGNAVRAF